jgi:hypothetical protein
VGTTSSSYHFHVDDDNFAAEISIDNDASNFKTALNTTNSVNADFNIQHKSNLTSIGTGVNCPLAFHINGSTNANSAEKMRLDGNGDLTVTGKIISGDSSGQPFFLNKTAVTTNTTVTSTYNWMSAGPMTINSGVTVTVNSGATWTVV